MAMSYIELYNIIISIGSYHFHIKLLWVNRKNGEFYLTICMLCNTRQASNIN